MRTVLLTDIRRSLKWLVLMPLSVGALVVAVWYLAGSVGDTPGAAIDVWAAAAVGALLLWGLHPAMQMPDAGDDQFISTRPLQRHVVWAVRTAFRLGAALLAIVVSVPVTDLIGTIAAPHLGIVCVPLWPEVGGSVERMTGVLGACWLAYSFLAWPGLNTFNCPQGRGGPVGVSLLLVTHCCTVVLVLALGGFSAADADGGPGSFPFVNYRTAVVCGGLAVAALIAAYRTCERYPPQEEWHLVARSLETYWVLAIVWAPAAAIGIWLIGHFGG